MHNPATLKKMILNLSFLSQAYIGDQLYQCSLLGTGR